ncbi:hypothetical protein Tco_1354777 [Tanacetum coccineum]
MCSLPSLPWNSPKPTMDKALIPTSLIPQSKDPYHVGNPTNFKGNPTVELTSWKHKWILKAKIDFDVYTHTRNTIAILSQRRNTSKEKEDLIF